MSTVGPVPDELIHLERRPDGVALVTLDRPKANALSVDMLAQLEATFAALAHDLPGAVVVWGGPRIFAAGADISGFGGPDEAVTYGHQFRAAFDQVAALPRVVIAAVAGYALGGGCELAMACDLRVVGDTAKLGQPEILLGIIPGAGGTQRLPRLVGEGRAKEMILLGRRLTASEALAWGLVNRVTPAGTSVVEDAIDWIRAIAEGAPIAQAAALEAIDGGLDVSLETGLLIEKVGYDKTIVTEDRREALAARAAKRAPRFQGK
jgi:enoyl-CoA hydratase